jgi:quinol monooxygenase YgiN
MYARSTTIHADPERIDAGIALVREELMDRMQEMSGCVGLSMLVDRDSGRCIVTSSWDSEEAMRATTERVRDVRQQAADAMSGEIDIQEWEVAVMHRVHPAGSCARVIWSRARDVGMMDRVIDAWKMILPGKLEESDGFCAVSLMVDRDTGRAVSTATYADRTAMDRAHDSARAMREEFAGAMDVDVTEVAEFDLVLAHLRVPEMA